MMITDKWLSDNTETGQAIIRGDALYIKLEKQFEELVEKAKKSKNANPYSTNEFGISIRISRHEYIFISINRDSGFKLKKKQQAQNGINRILPIAIIFRYANHTDKEKPICAHIVVAYQIMFDAWFVWLSNKRALFKHANANLRKILEEIDEINAFAPLNTEYTQIFNEILESGESLLK